MDNYETNNESDYRSATYYKSLNLRKSYEPTLEQRSILRGGVVASENDYNNAITITEQDEKTQRGE